jgi:hypothetical protein
MKYLKYNLNTPNDVGVIYNERKETKWEMVSQVTKGAKMNGEKKTTQWIPLTNANGGLNNR